MPHAVPVTFPALGDVVYFAVDHKPKSTWQLRRLSNGQENPSVTVLVAHYAEDWSTLRWARADGCGGALEAGQERHRAVELLCDKYDQYRDCPPQGPGVAIRVERWRSHSLARFSRTRGDVDGLLSTWPWWTQGPMSTCLMSRSP